VGGAVLPELSADFDRYWNSEVVTPVLAFAQRLPRDEQLREVRARWNAAIEAVRDSEYAQAIEKLDLVRDVREERLERHWGTCRVITDPPDKVRKPTSESLAGTGSELMELMEAAEGEILLISPYFVPGDDGSRWLQSIAKRGVRVRILTNSYLANDVGMVHAGYARHRDDLLEAGVELYELKPSANQVDRQGDAHMLAGSSQASLHAKIYMVDRKRLFVGSFNLDPRSARLNTEMGLVLETPTLAGRLADTFEKRILDLAYRVERKPADGELRWVTRKDGEEVVRDSEPGINWLASLKLFFLRLLPIEEQL
jgi:putative cardiolipin synthase